MEGWKGGRAGESYVVIYEPKSVAASYSSMTLTMIDSSLFKKELEIDVGEIGRRGSHVAKVVSK